jgi:aldose sugar dehydrogenase
MRRIVSTALFLLGACGPAGQPAAQTPPPPAAAAPVDDGPPNTTYQPAFRGQTRAPEIHSNVTLNVETIAEGLNHPWSIQFLPDGRALVSERSGAMRVVARGAPLSPPIAGLPPVDAREQGGLLDIALSPAFATDRLVYWSYSEPRGGGRNSTSVARGRLSEDATRLANVQVIFRQEPPWRSAAHFGSRLVWDRDGHLFVTMGERFLPQSRVHAQDLVTDLGKVVRINADGSIPPDNPFVGRADARPEIWSYGHRNVQGAALQPDTGKLWTIEHGPRGGDELNAPQAGKNYGWPIIGYGIDYSGEKMGDGITQHEGMEQPIYYWDPVIAPSGMTFYQGSLFPWRGDILIAALRGAVVRLKLDGEHVVGEERLLTDQGRIRDVQEAADGSVWVTTDEDEGRVLRLTPQN